jgi:23S rRNA pseudouridine1911/1915/1917 synthase
MNKLLQIIKRKRLLGCSRKTRIKKRKAQTLIHYLVRNPKQNKATLTVTSTQFKKKATLHYKLLQHMDNSQSVKYV